MVIISKFKLVFKNSFYKVISYEDVPCPLCGGKLECIGSRRRKYINEDGDTVWLSLRRLRCTKCLKIHHEIPSIIMPYHRICSHTIDLVIEERRDEAPIDDGTYKRLYLWWKLIKNYTNPIHTIDLKASVNAGLVDNKVFSYTYLISQNIR